MSRETQIDVERVICRLADIDDPGARGFAIGNGDWPLRGLIVRVRSEIRGYVNRCPHAGHPLNLRPHQFLTADASLILCASHGALFERLTGYCVAGPCAGKGLHPVPLKIESGFVLLGDEVEPFAYADLGR
jgi:nitrite reductase/ring-hydroxylating ferredoxin subunit